MFENNYIILSEMLTALEQELFEVNSQIQRNLLYIREEEACISSIESSDSEDFKMFYPRTLNSLQKAEIEKANSRKIDFEKENFELNKKKVLFEERIGIVKKVLSQESNRMAAIHVQEEDRKRIARDLHDTSLQSLTHLIHQIELCSLYIDLDPKKAKLELSVISKSLKETVNEIRNTIFDLRPLSFKDFSLKSGFERLLDNMKESGKYKITSDIDDVSCENNLVLLYIYRGVQESLNNVDRHAEADEVIFRCKVVNNICMIDIIDNGKGFCEGDEVRGDKHFGISLMRERIDLLGGRLDINSARGEGTKIHMEIPLREMSLSLCE